MLADMDDENFTSKLFQKSRGTRTLSPVAHISVICAFNSLPSHVKPASLGMLPSIAIKVLKLEAIVTFVLVKSRIADRVCC